MTLRNKNEIASYMDHVLHYYKPYDVSSTGEVHLCNDITISKRGTCIGDKKNLDVNIKTAKNMWIQDVDFETLQNTPTKCTSLTLNNCKNLPQHLIVNTITEHYLNISDMFHLKSIKIFGDLLNIGISHKSGKFYQQPMQLENIEIKTKSTKSKLIFDNCDFITSFKNIKLPKTVSYIDISSNGITSFEGLDAIITNTCTLRIRNMKSCRYVNNINANVLNIRFYNARHIINLLLNKSKRIIISHGLIVPTEIDEFTIMMNNEIEVLLDLYLDKENRTDFIMDCALALIERGYVEAAEL